jgi:hypothetical protein
MQNFVNIVQTIKLYTQCTLRVNDVNYSSIELFLKNRLSEEENLP